MESSCQYEYLLLIRLVGNLQRATERRVKKQVKKECKQAKKTGGKETRNGSKGGSEIRLSSCAVLSATKER